MTLRSFKDLIVWQKAILLVKQVYVLTEALPKSEAFGLAGQMRRAAISIPSNIAEGYKRKTPKNTFTFYLLLTPLQQNSKHK